MVRTQRRRGALPGLVAMLLATGSAVAGDLVRVDGDLHVRNGDTPSGASEVWRLDELWRAGGADDEETFFGLITRVLADEAGCVYLLDAQRKQVHVFGPGGDARPALSREGEGPGEVRSPRDLVLGSEGSVGLIEGFPGRVVTVDRQGNPISRAFEDRSSVQFVSAVLRGGVLVVGCVASQPGDRDLTSTRTSRLTRYSLNGQPGATYCERERAIDYQNQYVFSEDEAMVDFLWCFDVAPDGRVYAFTERDRYAISVFHPDGRLDRIIERAFVSRERTPEERRRMEALVERRFRTFPFDLTVEISDTEPAVNWRHRGLHVAEDGTLWVRHSRSGVEQPAGILLTYDLFDAEGHFVRQVSLAGEGSAETDGFFFVGNDRLVRVRGYVDAMRTVFGGGRGGFEGEGDPEPAEIVCYRLLH